jgi:WD40 repeat protein
LHTLTGHTGRVESVGWSPDGVQLASVGDDGKLIVWSPPTLHPELYLQLDKLFALSWTTAGIAMGGVNGVAVFDLQ